MKQIVKEAREAKFRHHTITHVEVSLTFLSPCEMSSWSSRQAVIPSFLFSSWDFLNLAVKTCLIVWTSYSICNKMDEIIHQNIKVGENGNVIATSILVLIVTIPLSIPSSILLSCCPALQQSDSWKIEKQENRRVDYQHQMVLLAYHPEICLKLNWQ